MRALISAALLSLVTGGCSNDDTSYDMGARCRAVGGACYIGGAAVSCIKQGPSGCESNPPTPAGRFCCLEFADAGDGG